MAEKFIDNHAARRLFPVVPTPQEPNKGDIVEYARKQKVEKIGDGPDDYLVGEEVVEVSRVNRQAYIAKDANDVGVLNILEKVRRSGDMTLFNQTHSPIPEGVQDYTNVPKDINSALKAVNQGANSFAALKAIFGDISFDKLATMSEAELNAAVSAYVAGLSKDNGGKEDVK